MNDTAVALIAMICAVNPAGFVLGLIHARQKSANGETKQASIPTIAGPAAVVSLVVIVALAVTGEPILEALDLAPESFRVALGAIFAAGGLRTVLFGHLRPPALPAGWPGILVPVAFPLILGAEVLSGTVGFAIDIGPITAIMVTALAVGAAAGLAVATEHRETRELRFALGATARVLAAVLVAIGAALIVDGVRDV